MAIPEYLEKYKMESKERAKENLEKMKAEKAEFKERQKGYLGYHKEYEKTLGKL